MFKRLKKQYQESNKKVFIIYLLLRIYVITVMILQIFNKNWDSVFYCVLTLFLFTLPQFVSKSFKIALPGFLEIIIYLFIFAAEMLGELANFYNNVSNWDTMLHTVNGFLCAAIGFALIDILNKSNKVKTHMTPIFVTFVSFCFSMTVGACWEIIEYSCDMISKSDMQKDKLVTNISTVYLNPEGANKAVQVNDIKYTIIWYDTDGDGVADESITINGGYLDIGIHDTMKDIIVNLIGAVVFSIFGFLYIKNREKYAFLENLMPTLKDEKLVIESKNINNVENEEKNIDSSNKM